MLMNLEVLTIESCELLEAVFDLEDELSNDKVIKWGRISLKPNVLKLSKLHGLIKIWTKIPNNISIMVNLRELEIFECDKLSYVFSSSMAKSLKNLSCLSIKHCIMMEGVFMEQMSTGENQYPDLQCLKELIIEGCDKMNSFIFLGNKSGDVPTMASFFNSKVRLPSLESLVLKVGKFKSIWDSSISEQSFHKLTSVVIGGCASVTVISPSIVVKRLQELKEVKVMGSSAIEVIFQSEEENLMMSQLRMMELVDLQSLKHIAMSNGIVNQGALGFPSLTDVIVKDCHNLINLFDGASTMTLSELKKLNISHCKNMKEVFSDSGGGEYVRWKTMAFDKLSSLELEGLDNLTRFCLGFPSLPSLTDISVKNCDNLINLFDTATAMTLSELKTLKISRCEKMKEVFSDNGADENVGWKAMAFNKLSSLELYDLVNLAHFCSGYSDLCFLVLKTLRVITLKNFKSFIPNLANAEGQKADNEDGVFSSLFDEKVKLRNLEELEIEGLESKEIWHDKFPSGSFCRLQVLTVEACRQISYVIPSFMLQNLHNLEQLTVESCDMVETIFQLDGYTLRGRKLARSTVCKLKKIHLSKLPNLHSLHKSESFPEYFPFHELESVIVKGCNSLRNLFTICTAKLLKKLQELTITECAKMEVIVHRGNADHNDARYKALFPQLSVLKLTSLNELRSFCTEKHTTEWPSLKQIEIEDCSAIEALVSDSEHKPVFLVEKESRGNNKKSAAFPKLESIRVSKCRSLSTIFRSTIILGGFQNLVSLAEEHCEGLRKVFQVEDSNEEKISWGNNKEEEGVYSDNDHSGVIFGKLKSMEIKWCKNLSTIFPSTLLGGFRNLESLRMGFCDSLKEVFQVDVKERNEESASTDDIIGFENLRNVDIFNCWRLEHVFPASVARCLHQLSDIYINDCKSMEEIVVWKEDFNKHNEVAAHPTFFFPKLSSLRLSVMPLLKSFHRGSHSTKWPLLQRLRVYGCPTAKILSSKQQEYWNNNDEEKANNNNSTESLSFKATDIEMDMLQIPDEIIGNPTNLKLSNIKGEAAVQAFPWRLLLERPHNLRHLTISSSDFEEISPWPANREDGYGHGQENDEIVPLSPYRSETGVLLIENITRLYLYWLPELKHLWKEGSALASILDVVEQLEVEYCHLLRGILCASSSSTCASASFHNLKVLRVIECEGVRHVLTCSTARCLVHLTELYVSDCDNLEEIVTHDNDDDSNGRVKDEDNTYAYADITFHRLSKLTLRYLGLGWFSYISCNFNFPCLVELDLKGEGWKEYLIGNGIVRAPLLSEKRRRELGIQV